MQTRRSLSTIIGTATIGAAALARGASAQTTAPSSGEATLDRVRRSGVLRIAALPGETPFFEKDLASGTWSGAAIDMARSIASALNAKLEYVEATYGTSVLDLQSNKVDLAFALNPTAQRALSIGFSRAYYMHPFGYVSRPGFPARNWEDLNRPDVRVVSLIGSLTDTLVARYAPKAQVIGVKDGSNAILTMQSGRGDCIVYGLVQGLSVSAKAPELSQMVLLRKPLVALPSAMGVQQEPDRRWRDFLDAWVDYNAGSRQVADWMRTGLLKMGVKADTIPADADL
ncbi:MAG TPA: transporter substrate-binding domain-containing protein [Acetobacteraceae bacterium]|nr:transporter substrate-binding domain-containing protein [Acetobacteraceae bacterium]